MPGSGQVGGAGERLGEDSGLGQVKATRWGPGPPPAALEEAVARWEGQERGLKRTQGSVRRKPPGGASASLLQHWRRQWPTQDLRPPAGCSLWGNQCLKSGSRDRLRQTAPPSTACRRDEGKGEGGPTSGPRPLSPGQHRGGGREAGSQCILLTQGLLRNPTQQTDGRQIYIINNN